METKSVSTKSIESSIRVSRTNIINLFILAIAIILVCLAKNKFSELFVPQVQLPPYLDSYGAQGGHVANSYPSLAGGVHPQGNPNRFQNQIYPARIPYYAELGRPCTNQKDCGVLGKCEGGSCNSIPYEKTVFNDRIPNNPLMTI